MTSLRYYKIIVIMLSVLFLPSFVYVALHASSMAIGLIISFIIAMVLVSKKKIPKIKSVLLYVLSILFIMQYTYLLLSDNNLVFEKQIISFIVLVMMFVSAAFYSMELQKVSNKNLISFIKWLAILILILGFLSRISIDFFHYTDYPTGVFPYAEPSHYVLATGGILLAAGFFVNSNQRIILIMLLVILTILFPSTLLLLLVIIMLMTYYSSGTMKVTILSLIFILIMLYVSNNIGDFSYFSERLDTSSDNHNLTTMVYLQGLDDAHQSFIETNGMGLGFQNMGSLPPSDLSELIYHLSGKYKNRNDGGFLAAKIIAEFGAIGLVLLFYYLIKVYQSFLFLRNMTGTKHLIENTPAWLILGHSIIVVFFLEIFVRGVGYFSPSVFLTIVSLIMIRKKNL